MTDPFSLKIGDSITVDVPSVDNGFVQVGRAAEKTWIMSKSDASGSNWRVATVTFDDSVDEPWGVDPVSPMYDDDDRYGSWPEVLRVVAKMDAERP